MRKLRNDLDQIKQSLKMPEVEEKYDIYFSRFIGFYLAKIGAYFNLTPTNITVLSMISGIVGGGLFYFQENLTIVIIASILLTLAGLLDSADGQLARMTGQSTEFGRVLDGAADTVVFIACYSGATAFFVFRPEPILWYIPLAMAAGFVYHLMTCVYDLYKSEMLFYGGQYENASDYSINDLEKQRKQMTGLSKFLQTQYIGYIKRQYRASSRKVNSDRMRQVFSSENRDEFSRLYIKYQQGPLNGWAWVAGLNVHRWGIIISCLFARFDIYLALALFSIVGLLIMNRIQLTADKRLLAHFD